MQLMKKRFRRATVVLVTKDFELDGRAYRAGSTAVIADEKIPALQTVCRPMSDRGARTDKSIHAEALSDGD